MRKYTKFLFFIVIFIFFSLIVTNLKVKQVYAEDTDPDVALINSIIESNDYNQQIQNIISGNFSKFDIAAAEFNQLVTGKSNYKILEITPRTYTDTAASVSDINANLTKLTNIYQDITHNNDYTSNYFISNMKNFTVDTMTMKELVDNRDELDGKYDAIVFDAGDYTTNQVETCDYMPDSLPVIHVEIRDRNHHLLYTGGSTKLGSTLDSIIPNGYGEMYNQNGTPIYKGYYKSGKYNDENGQYFDQNGNLRYQGGWKDGKRSCYGKSFDQNKRETYQGQWRDDDYYGYGDLWDQNGSFKYRGYFFHNEESPNGIPNSDVLNDITALKADEIINDYIKTGLPVFFSSGSLSDSYSVLYQKFHQYINYSNVYLTNYEADNSSDNMDFDTALSIMKITELSSSKPSITFNEKPTDFSDDATVRYQPNEMINFDFNLTNKDNADLMFYVDVNQNEKIDDSELAYTLIIQKGENSFSFKLPTVYSGLLKYQIVVSSDDKSSLYEGTLNVKGEVKNIKVLNIVSDMVNHKDGLLDPTLYSEYFQNNGDYNITVDRITINDFSKNNPKWGCSHYTVMDNYDVILLGQDIFDTSVNTHVYNSLQEQIDNGKPVIFTSSVTKGNSKWIDYFSDDMSLSDYRTDLYKLDSNVDKLQIVNNSSFVTYPFNMNNEQLLVPEDLNYALNEAYQMNINNATMTPLMNMYNSTNTLYDRYDSYNNYYYTKNNNVVYLNVGNNSFNTYKDIEHKLLVDSIVNLYVQDNAKNQKLDNLFSISYSNTFENKIVDINDQVNFAFTVFNNQADTYSYTVTANSKKIQSDTITNNQLVNVDLSNIASPNIGAIKEVLVSVVISNSKHERNTYSFYVNVANLDSYSIQLVPTVLNGVKPTDENFLQVSKSGLYSNNYQVTLGNIPASDSDPAHLPKTITLHDVTFKQKIPDNIHIDDINYPIVNQYLTKDLGDYTYTLVGNTYIPDPYNPINLTVPFTVNSVGNYTFSPATLTFDGFGNDIGQLQNQSVSFQAIKPLTPSMVTPIFTDYLFIPFGDDRISDLTKKFTISNDASIQSITFHKTDDGDKFILDGNTLTPKTVGEQAFEMDVTDVFGNVVKKPFNVITYVPISNIKIQDHSMYVGDSVTLPFDVDTSNIQKTLVNQTPNVDVVDIEKNGNQYDVTGLNVGFATYEFYGYDSNGYVVSTTVTFVVNEHLDIYFNNNKMSTFVDESIAGSDMAANVEVHSDTFHNSDVRWRSLDESIATVDEVTGALTPHSPGTVVIEAYLPNTATARLIVKVYDNLTDNSGFDPALDTIKVYQGYEQYLEDYIKLDPSTLTKDDVTMTFSYDDPDNLLAYFDTTTNTFNTKADASGYITLYVTIEQKNNAGVVVKTVDDTYVLQIRAITDPNIDSGDNTH